MNIGIYGGRFDPFHRAHLGLVDAALDQLRLDALHIVVAARPVHREVQAHAQHRIAMAELGVQGRARVIVDRRECERPGESYSVDTVESFRDQYPNARLFLILGSDQLENFSTWHRWQDILNVVTLAIAERPGTKPGIPDTIQDVLNFSARNRAAANSGFSVGLPRFLHVPPSDISATELRRLLHEGRQADHALDPAVLRYIQEHQLYAAVPQRSAGL